ncbi:MAG: NnrU family protein [Dokdonella sp.]
MAILILGLLIFLGAHSTRVFADGWRTQMIARVGANGWKGIYSIASIVGFVLIVWGFGLARAQPVLLYVPPMALKHINALFSLLAFVLLAAAYVPRNHLKAAIGHPMVVAVKVWSFGHLLAVGWLHDVVLFGAFFVWAVMLFAASRRRDRRTGTTYPRGTLIGTLGSVVIGAAAWALFAFWLHVRWIGVSPFG